MGNGDISDEIIINDIDLPPLPILLISTKETIFLQDIDIKEKYPLVNGITMPTAIDFIFEEKKIFWINDLRELFVLNLSNSTKPQKILEFKSNPFSFSIDWIARVLYIVVANVRGCSIQRLDLNYIERNILKTEEILSRDVRIEKIQVSPFTRYALLLYIIFLN